MNHRSELRRQQLTDLGALVQDKTNIERDIMQSMQNLQRAYRSTYQEVKCAVEGRVSDLE